VREKNFFGETNPIFVGPDLSGHPRR